jgi:RecB family exonuclease
MRLQFRGFIDRLDRHVSHAGLLVIDYKSGRTVDATRFPSAGQLVVYLLAATGGDDALLDVSEGRFVHVTRRGDFAVQRMLGRDVRQRKEAFKDLVLSVAHGVAQGDFHPEPGDNAAHCTFCDYRGLCDGRIGQQAERKSVAGQRQRFESLPDFADLLHELPESTSGRAG